MDCTRCGSANAATHSFCAFCGNPLPYGPEAEGGTILFAGEEPARSSTDTGFLLLAVLFLSVASLWFTWTYFGPRDPAISSTGFRIMAVITTLINLAEIAIMARFTRRTRYRALIIACGLAFFILECLLYGPLWSGNQ
ncbi:MAG: hypothetical protein EOO11_20800 [Chitinophagaceae bacterium]|nr:MAG: hypothetical protein EOO11_20800 [Chitinophagaceae bacterium]